MTDEEFRKWTRHTAENALAQVADLQGRLAEAQRQRDEKGGREILCAAERDEARAEVARLQAEARDAAGLREQLAVAEEQLRAMGERLNNHPAVVEARRLAAALAEAGTLIDALGGTELGRRMAREKKAAELRRQAGLHEQQRAAALAEAERLDRGGVTMPELLVCLSVLAVFFGLLLPAVQRVRESANVVRCRNNLRQVAAAANGFHATHDRFPSAGDYLYQGPAGAGSGWGVQLLPHMEDNRRVLCCPSKPGPRVWLQWGRDSYAQMTDYAGCHGPLPTGPVGYHSGYYRLGTSNTLGWAEKRLNLSQAGFGRTYDDDFGPAAGVDWDAMRTHTLQPLPDFAAPVADATWPEQYSTQHGGWRFGSSHAAGLVTARLDGSVCALAWSVDPYLFALSGTVR